MSERVERGRVRSEQAGADGSAWWRFVEPRSWRLRLMERRSLVGRTAAALGHEVGTPLNVVAGRASLILRESSEPAVLRHAGIILEQVQRIAGILREAVAFGALGAKAMDRSDAGRVIEAACALAEPVARARGVDLRCDLPSRTCVTGPEDRIVEAFAMLLDHALGRSARGDVLTLTAEPYEATSGDDADGARVAIAIRGPSGGDPMELRGTVGRPPWRPGEAGTAADLEVYFAGQIASALGGAVECNEDLRGVSLALVLPVPENGVVQ